MSDYYAIAKLKQIGKTADKLTATSPLKSVCITSLIELSLELEQEFEAVIFSTHAKPELVKTHILKKDKEKALLNKERTLLALAEVKKKLDKVNKPAAKVKEDTVTKPDNGKLTVSKKVIL